MPIFIDTCNIGEIKKFLKMGIIRGVTTNPTIIYKENLTGGIAGLEKTAREIAELIHPLPLSIEVLSNDPIEMVKQAEEFSKWSDNMVIKITVHGPNGETDNVGVIHELETKRNIRVNATAMMSAQQCFLIAMAGATYVSIFSGRVNDMGYNSLEEIKKLRQLLELHKLKSEIISASTREVINVVEWLTAGAHIVTVIPNFLEKMIVHPYSKETVQMFLADATKISQ